MKFSDDIRHARAAEGKNPQRLSFENLEEPSARNVALARYLPWKS